MKNNLNKFFVSKKTKTEWNHKSCHLQFISCTHPFLTIICFYQRCSVPSSEPKPRKKNRYQSNSVIIAHLVKIFPKKESIFFLGKFWIRGVIKELDWYTIIFDFWTRYRELKPGTMEPRTKQRWFLCTSEINFPIYKSFVENPEMVKIEHLQTQRTLNIIERNQVPNVFFWNFSTWPVFYL